ncbi:MAG TPA: lysophospholipid acyltransferase family protein [Candidatus Polarisedimenticolia bacterium]|nr:lysophospholipid acyltransferase family protein [Candidatus Polarisedimenticolia bacterium]
MRASAAAPSGPFRLPSLFTDPVRRALLDAARPLLEKGLALPRLNDLYRGLAAGDDGRPFADRALEALDVAMDVDAADVSRIPAAGPLVVVANHPFGGLDGLLLGSLLRRVRPDVRLLGNVLLRSIPELDEILFFVDPFGGGEAVRRNAAAVRAALRWVRGGGCLGIFPAGEVSHATLASLRVADGAWSPALGRLVRAGGASAVAVWFEGRNSAAFQALGLIHPRLRTLMLPRELLRRRRSRVAVRVGNPVTAARLGAMGSDEEITGYLRARAHVLRGRAPAAPAAGDPREPVRKAEPIAEAVEASLLAAEVAALPASQTLVESGPFRVLHARAPQIPRLLREVGRQREAAFRRAGEGTGRALDLDPFDERYIHLILWHGQKREVAGGYRIGPTDEILPACGVGGLYTSTLFRYREELLRQIGPALEMGRSFVRLEYQRSHSPLALLWRGIGAYVAAHLRYRRLFGPVSISNDYRSMSRSLLLSFLRMHRQVGDLARLIRPRRGTRLAALDDPEAGRAGAVVRTLEEVDELIREIESDRLSMPVLLRQYLKLNGVLLGFTVDHDFGDVLDGLILVDLARVDRHLLARYMGKEGMASFLAHHLG